MIHIYLFWLIIGIILVDFIWEKYLSYLNTKLWSDKIPAELEGIYDADKYKKQQEYSRVNHKFSNLSGAFSLAITLLVLGFDGFALIDSWAGLYSDSIVFRALIFFGVIGLGSTIIGLPFSYYGTFVIEERFEFNKTTRKTFFFDLIKSLLIGAILGGGLLALIIWLFEVFEERFWIYAWGVVTFFMLFMTMFYTSVFLPLFNKQTPLENGELKSAIQQFCDKVNFKLDNVFVMNGSKRSTKANAFFSGLGSRKRIVLYDTLVNDLTVDEIVGVLAHEIGHYKKKHTLWGMILSVAQTGILFYLFSLFVNSPELSMALGVSEPTFHIGLIAFALLYSPVSGITGLGMVILSRKNEYEADRYAVQNHNAEALISALKTISVNALSNLTPHPWYVFFHYSHPPLLQRVRAMKAVEEV